MINHVSTGKSLLEWRTEIIHNYWTQEAFLGEDCVRKHPVRCLAAFFLNTCRNLVFSFSLKKPNKLIFDISSSYQFLLTYSSTVQFTDWKTEAVLTLILLADRFVLKCLAIVFIMLQISMNSMFHIHPTKLLKSLTQKKTQTTTTKTFSRNCCIQQLSVLI